MTSPKLFDHQCHMRDFWLKKKRVLNFSEPGTGKTAAALDAIAQCPAPGRALVLAPKSILVPAWVNDCLSFTPNLSIAAAYAKNRREAFELGTKIVVTNHDASKWLLENKELLGEFDKIIIDESTVYKHKDAARSKAIAKLVKLFEYRLALTGTPMPNGLLDIWHQVYLIDDGEHLGTKYYAFRAATHDPVLVTMDIRNWVEKPGAREVVADLLADITIRYRLADCTDLPAQHLTTRTVGLSKKLRRHYDAMAQQAMLELEHGNVTAVHAAAQVNKLAQICIAKNTEVLTHCGWVPIQHVQDTHILWDGHEWVPHGGLIDQGVQRVIQCYGVNMTPDHSVLTTKGWKKAEDICNGNARYRSDRKEVWLPNGYPTGWLSKKVRNLVMSLRLWTRSDSQESKSTRQEPPESEALQTYDIRDVGQRNQFVVRGNDGQALIVHNCSGAVYDDTGYYLLDTQRYDLVAELCTERPHTLVAFQWRHQRDGLIAALERAGIDGYAVIDGATCDVVRSQIVQDFQAGHYRVLLAHPQSAGHGLTLTKAKTIVWASPTWNAEHFEQFNRLIYRTGQDERTEVILIQGENTVDEKICAAAQNKMSKQSDLLQLLKSLNREAA